MTHSVLQVSGLQVSFGEHEVLRGVDLDVGRGECLAVVGPSGAGKSVLARSLLGLADEGGGAAQVRASRLQIGSAEMSHATSRRWRNLRGQQVGLVLQDALGSLDPLRTLEREVAESLRGSATEQRVIEALQRAGLPDPETMLRQLPGALSGGMRQRALIASAIVANPPLLILDEPTTALDATVAAGVLDLLAQLRDAGTAMVLVTHDFDAVVRLADRVAVLDEGAIVECGRVREVLTSPRSATTQALLAALPRGKKSTPPPPLGAATVLAAENLTRRYPIPGGERLAVDDVSLELHDGEALAVVGESGSGKSTLARLLIAAEEPDSGRVLLDGAPWSPLRERDRRNRRSRIRLVGQDSLGSMDPRRNVATILRDVGAHDTSAVADLLASVQLPVALAGRMPRNLSGGQRQRVAIARALAAQPQILLLDEPVSALDVQVQAGILDLLTQLQRARSVAMVLISHDLAVVRRLCDRVMVMSGGRVVETGRTEEVWAAPQHEVTRMLLSAAHPWI